MRKKLTAAERLIVAADFKPSEGQGKEWVKSQVLSLANELRGTGVYIKVNSILRACGYDLIREIQDCGLKVFADLKLVDISETLSTDGALLQEAQPDLLTVMASAGHEGLVALKSALPNVEVLAVTILTSLKLYEVALLNGERSIANSVCIHAKVAKKAGMDGVICAPTEATSLRSLLGDGMTINTPGIRPSWAIVPGDDQNPDRIMTPAKAIKAGADRIVIGRPIMQAPNRREAAMRTIDEIATASL